MIVRRMTSVKLRRVPPLIHVNDSWTMFGLLTGVGGRNPDVEHAHPLTRPAPFPRYEPWRRASARNKQRTTAIKRGKQLSL
jgi:hypothetical protein